MMDEQDFKKRADEALTALHRALIGAADDFGFDVDFNSGALGIEFEDPPAKFVVSPNTPVRQVWVSALAKSYKLDWDIVENTFVHVESGDTLKDLIEKVISKQLHEEVSL
ncbi:MAG TPA: iron donor protein CyaY [Bryobacteraceae bacterium]|nr:iron donor protein CyaY [Bryobacteraceae bacterium]